MIKIAEVVAQLVQQSPFLTEALAEGLINSSALARRFQPEVEKALGKPVQTGAILMAINRMPTAGALAPAEKTLRQFFRKLSDISVRSNLSDYTYLHSDTLLNKQVRLLAVISKHPKAFYSFSQGVSETTILIPGFLEPQMESIFKGERLLEKEKDLSAITLMLPAENRALYGIYYYIMKELAWHGINVVEVISTSNEFTLVVTDQDLDQAFSVLMGLKK